MSPPSGASVPVDVVPSREEFVALAKSHAIIAVAAEIIADTLTPVAAFAALAEDRAGFLLESAEGDERWGRYSFVGTNPLGTYVRQPDGTTRTTGVLPTPAPGDGVLSYLERFLSTHSAPVTKGLPPLHGGLVGLLAYDVVREIERLESPGTDDLGHPDAALQLIGDLLAFDHWRQRATLIVNVPVAACEDAEAAERYDAAVQRISGLLARLAVAPRSAPFQLPARDSLPVPTTTSNRTSEDYRAAVEVAKEHIVAGDVFQVVLSQRFDCSLEVDPFEVYRALRVLNPSPYLYFLRFEGCTVLGSSPEALVRLRDGRVTVRPIAGSRRRGVNEADDERLGAELLEHPKERAEHVMLVDLGRNDLGRVCAYGSIEVDELMTLERYSHVMHLTSQVSGQLADGVGPVDVLRATLPAGTLSGAPKVRAMELIDELEPTRRGVYGGVVGYLDLCGNLDTAIAIRTLVVNSSGTASVQAGAGIVFDSDPAMEDEECHTKAAALLAAISAAARGSGGVR